jgi:small subunit ribosomal protein S1
LGKLLREKLLARENRPFFLDLGAVGTGIIYGKEFFEAKDKIKGLKIGETLFAKIIDLENEDGYIELSVSQAGKELTLAELFQKKEKGEILKVKIKGANKGGLITEISGIPAFLPLSQLSPEHYPRVEGGETSKILRELQKFIGQELEVKIFNLSPKGDQIILSERAKELDKIKEILKNYKVGDVVEGEIVGLTDFGAFMKFGEGLEGLIHISELDWKIIEDPAEIVKVGEKVKAKIIEIKDDKIALSLKALKKDPWLDIEKKYKKGEIVSGKVTKFNPFGAFVQIEPEIQGLCHISEFGTKSKMEEKLKIGKKYNFQILEIRPSEHKMSLKLVEKI